MISPETGMTPLEHCPTLSFIDQLNNYKYISKLGRATSNNPIHCFCILLVKIYILKSIKNVKLNVTEFYDICVHVCVIT